MLELAMRGTATASLVAGVFGLVGCGSSESIHLRALAGAFVRLNQVGVVAGDRPHAELLAASPLSGAEVSVVQADGHSVASGRLGPDAGAWSAGFAHVYPIDVAPLRSSGTYQLVVRRGAAGVISPRFRVAGAGALYAPLVANALFFMRAQRDGAAVDPGTLSRSPAHLADRSASIVATPSFTGGALRGRLARSGGPVDVSGGWSDAGDYLKFVETASFSDLMILFARRQYPGAFHGAGDRGGQEGRFGLDWLLKMWDPARRRLLYQVGIGDGNGFDVTGTHDLWMLPQASDALDVRPGNPRYFIKYRPVFAANGPVSPNLAGRLAAAFGLCAQLYAKSDPTYAARCLTAGQTVYGAAQTRNVSGLLTTAPRDFYPETEWRDDMALGAAELALGMASAGRSPAYYLARSADWASAYAASTSGAESLNVYDVSALADYELAQALDKLHAPDTLSVTRADLLDDLQSKLADGSTRARRPVSPSYPICGRRHGAARARLRDRSRPLRRPHAHEALRAARQIPARLGAGGKRLGIVVRRRCRFYLPPLSIASAREPERLARRAPPAVARCDRRWAECSRRLRGSVRGVRPPALSGERRRSIRGVQRQGGPLHG
ncbi:MAG: hypothetical protein NVSMB25_08160 [Thermoleophilaceae bacterium]